MSVSVCVFRGQTQPQNKEEKEAKHLLLVFTLYLTRGLNYAKNDGGGGGLFLSNLPLLFSILKRIYRYVNGFS